MDTIIEDIATIVQQEVEDYARGLWANAAAYAISDTVRQIYTVMAVPEYPRKYRAGIVVMARVVSDIVIIEEDITDKPLVYELQRAGIPREKIICTYAGEIFSVASG